MSTHKTKRIALKIGAVVLTLLLFINDLSWALFSARNTEMTTLAIEKITGTDPMTDLGRSLQREVFSEARLISCVLEIGKNLLSPRDIAPDLSVKGGKVLVSDRLKREFAAAGISEIRRNGEIVEISIAGDSGNYIIRMAEKGRVTVAELGGRSWEISQKYDVTIMTVDTKLAKTWDRARDSASIISNKNALNKRSEELLTLNRGFLCYHSERVWRITSIIGEERGLSPDKINLLRCASLLHDVGGRARGEHEAIFFDFQQRLRNRYPNAKRIKEAVEALVHEECQAAIYEAPSYEIFKRGMAKVLKKEDLSKDEEEVLRALYDVPGNAMRIFKEAEIKISKDLEYMIRYHDNYRGFVADSNKFAGELNMPAEDIAFLISILYLGDIFEQGNNYNVQFNQRKKQYESRGYRVENFDETLKWAEEEFKRIGVKDMGPIAALRRALAREDKDLLNVVLDSRTPTVEGKPDIEKRPRELMDSDKEFIKANKNTPTGSPPLGMGGMVWNETTKEMAKEAAKRIQRGEAIKDQHFEPLARAISRYEKFITQEVLKRLSQNQTFVAAVESGKGGFAAVKDKVLEELRMADLARMYDELVSGTLSRSSSRPRKDRAQHIGDKDVGKRIAAQDAARKDIESYSRQKGGKIPQSLKAKISATLDNIGHSDTQLKVSAMDTLKAFAERFSLTKAPKIHQAFVRGARLIVSNLIDEDIGVRRCAQIALRVIFDDSDFIASLLEDDISAELNIELINRAIEYSAENLLSEDQSIRNDAKSTLGLLEDQGLVNSSIYDKNFDPKSRMGLLVFLICRCEDEISDEMLDDILNEGVLAENPSLRQSLISLIDEYTDRTAETNAADAFLVLEKFTQVDAITNDQDMAEKFVKAVYRAIPVLGDPELCYFAQRFLTSVVKSDKLMKLPAMQKAVIETIEPLIANLESDDTEIGEDARVALEAISQNKNMAAYPEILERLKILFESGRSSSRRKKAKYADLGAPHTRDWYVGGSLKDFYGILGISPSATLEQVKKAYREMAFKNHPDMNPEDKGAEARFKEGNEAYGILRNPGTRERYDALRQKGSTGEDFQGGNVSFDQLISLIENGSVDAAIHELGPSMTPPELLADKFGVVSSRLAGRSLNTALPNNEIRANIIKFLEKILETPSLSTIHRPAASLINFIALKEEFRTRAKDFEATLSRILAEHPEELFFIGVEDDIGKGSQHSQIMPIYTAVSKLENLLDENGNKRFPNLIVRRGKAEKLVAEINKLIEKEKGRLTLDRTFIVARKDSMPEKKEEGCVYNDIIGNAWIAVIDDSDRESYLPIFEAIYLNMLAYLKAVNKADLSGIKDFYDKIAKEPIDPVELEKMLSNRIIRILPKATRFDPTQLMKLYEMAKEIYLAT